jgi:hypothetical protein
MQVHYFTFRTTEFACSQCGWKGKGSELSDGEFNDVFFIMDLECPTCNHHMGFWQVPGLSEIESWKKDHPQWKDGD